MVINWLKQEYSIKGYKWGISLQKTSSSLLLPDLISSTPYLYGFGRHHAQISVSLSSEKNLRKWSKFELKPDFDGIESVEWLCLEAVRRHRGQGGLFSIWGSELRCEDNHRLHLCCQKKGPLRIWCSLNLLWHMICSPYHQLNLF